MAFLSDISFSDNLQVGMVSNFSELVETEFQGTVNALCWPRNLRGNFEEIVSKIQLKDNITEISADDLLALELSDEGNFAREIILNDLQYLTDFGALPSLNLLKCYERDEELDFSPRMYIHIMWTVRPSERIHFYVPITGQPVILSPTMR